MTGLEPPGSSSHAGRPRVELVVTDLDGTLWDSEGVVHARTRQAIAALRDRNVALLVATARRGKSTRTLMEHNDIELDAVLLDGALGRTFGEGETFHRRAFLPSQARAILVALAQVGISPCVNLDACDQDVICPPESTTSRDHRRWLEPWILDASFEEAVKDHAVLSLSVAGCDPGQMELAAVALSTRHPCEVSVSRDLTYGGCGLSVRPLGANKWTGALAYCESRGLDSSRVLAVGDGSNDIEMLKNAAVSIAVAGGSKDALRIAQSAIGPPSVGGWAGVLAFV